MATAISMLTFSAMAQQPQSIPPSTPTEFHLTIKPTDVNTLAKALGKLPFEEVADLMQSLRSQIIDQQVPRKVEAPQEPKKD